MLEKDQDGSGKALTEPGTAPRRETPGGGLALEAIEARLRRIEPWEPGWDFEGMTEEDKTFAGHACKDVAALIAEVRRLRDLLAPPADGMTLEALSADLALRMLKYGWTKPQINAYELTSAIAGHLRAYLPAKLKEK
jgi:hypothetical protein